MTRAGIEQTTVCLSLGSQEDVVCLLCSSGDGTRRGYLAADGFGSEFCYLEPETRGEVSPFTSAVVSCCVENGVVCTCSFVGYFLLCLFAGGM